MNRLIAALPLIIFTTPSFAQNAGSYETAEERGQRITTAKPGPEQFYADLVGKTFWYRPGTEKYSGFSMYLGAKADRHGIVQFDQEIFPRVLTKFEILESYVPGKSRSGTQDQYVYRLRLEDGTMAFMAANSLGIYIGVPRKTPLVVSDNWDPLVMAKNLDSPLYRETYVFTEDPRGILERDDRQQREARELAERQRLAREVEVKTAERARIASAKANAKKGGVRIGMTRKQVLASSWGEPDDINRTITASTISEQWVYASSYLYFQNGVLTTIQN